MNESPRAVFLDRDGVINKEVSYLSSPEDFEFIEGTIEALKILKQKSFLLIIITNQAGIARGYCSEQTLSEIHDKMNFILRQNNVILDDIFHCSHHPDFTGECSCRKPKPGMILYAKEKYNIDIQNSFMIGDTLNDIKAGFNAKCKTVLVLTGYGEKQKKEIGNIKPDFIFDNLLDFAKTIKF